MDINREACPFDDAIRASRCESCCHRHGLPPCVAAWLAARLDAPLAPSLVSHRDAKKAA
ncbi:MAG: hypothetical protein Kow0010_18140 [Dehalococcoidia bacterium]